MNEELQSSNEELATSKEELQSLNEELTTVNNQLQNKIAEVEATNDELNNLLSSTNIATLFLDRELRIRRFTPATTRLMNLIPEDVGRPVVDIRHEYVDDNLPEDCQKVLEDLQPVERELLGEGGRWYIRRVQPYRTQDNRIEGTVVTFSDVTEMKRREAEHARLASIVESSENAIIERKRVEQVLLDADRRKNEFLAVLGHELRNPLAPIRNAIHILSRQEALTDKVRWAVDLIGRQSGQLEHLVNDLLDIGRITSLQIQLRKTLVVIQDALEDALISAAPLLEKYEQHLETRIPEAPLLVMADPVRLAQVFTNLLRNAAKYTPDGGHIEVTLTREGQCAVVRIRDDGIGIRTEYLPHLFDLFSRGETEHPNSHDADGLGVGLALSKQLMEQHGGTIEGHSDGPGQGSLFTVSLPLSMETKLPASPVESSADTEPQYRARRILMVDDNPEVTNSFRVLLEAMGHRVRTLNDGREALGAIRIFRPDAVFLDIAMPGMDGYQVASAIRAARPHPQPLLIALTGLGQEDDRKMALEAGFDRHLLKPLNPKQIDALLAELD